MNSGNVRHFTTVVQSTVIDCDSGHRVEINKHEWKCMITVRTHDKTRKIEFPVELIPAIIEGLQQK